MKKLKGVLVNYDYDWRKIKKSYHVSRDKERSERLRGVKRHNEIKYAILIPEEKKLYLRMDNKYTLVVQQKKKRKNDLLITVLPHKRGFKDPMKMIDVDLDAEPIDLVWEE